MKKLTWRVVFLLRDRDGEDTHQNIIHDTVLSFGKVTSYIIYRCMYMSQGGGGIQSIHDGGGGGGGGPKKIHDRSLDPKKIRSV